MQKVISSLGLFLGLLVPLFYHANCQNEFDAGVGQQQTTFGQEVDEEALKIKLAEAINTTEKRTFLYHSADKKLMAVYDKLFKGRVILTLRSYLTTLGQDSWLFNNYDPEHLNKQRASDNVPWVNYRDPMEFNRMLVCKTLVKAINDLTGKKEDWFPYKVTGKVLRRGDHTKIVADSSAPDEFSVLLYLNSRWRKNHYGELYFFDDEKEIMHGVTPRPGRVVIWDSSILRLTRPPSISQNQGQILLHITFSKSKQKMNQEHIDWVSFWNSKLEAKKTWYLPKYEVSKDKELVPNVADHVVANYSTLKGEKLFVFDDLFPVDLLDHMRAHVLKYGTYFYDDHIDTTSDNVQWIAALDMPNYLESPYWKIIKAVATFASGSPEWFPYDVSTNLIRNADHTRIHLDTSDDYDKEWTFLVYLNPNWTRNFYGETAFFETNSDDTEIVAEVRPRYGRAVIFQGQIPHSARPPSLSFTGARLTFVTKLQRNEYHGRVKNFEQEFRQFKGHSSQVESLDILSQTGNTENYISQMKSIRDEGKKYKAPQNPPEGLPQGEEEGTQGQEDGAKEEEGGQGQEGGAQGEEDGAQEEEGGQGQEDGAQGEEDGAQEEEGAEGEDDGAQGEEEGGQGEEDGNQEGGDENEGAAGTGTEGEETEEPVEEDTNPVVNYIEKEFRNIKAGKVKDPSRIAKLYKEMKAGDAKIMLQMSEKFPSIL